MPLLIELFDAEHREWLAVSTYDKIAHWLRGCGIKSRNFQWDVATGVIKVFMHPHDIDRSANNMNTIVGVRARNVSHRSADYRTSQPTINQR
jgi:hypothetical protein